MSITLSDGRVCRVADAHAHVYKQKIATKASDAIGQFYEVVMDEPEPTADALVARCREVGVDECLVFSVATKESQVASINEFIAAEVAARDAALAAGEGGPRFIGMGTAHADVADWDALLDQIEALGLHGVKMHPDMQGFNLDDPRLMPLYRKLAQRGLAVALHVGDERYEFSAPERLVRVLEAVPDLRVHAAHFGCCRIWKRRPVAIARAVQAGADIVFDTSSMLQWASVDDARYLVDLLGPERIMWGTDFPMWDAQTELDCLLALGCSDDELEAMLHGTFARFYGAE